MFSRLLYSVPTFVVVLLVLLMLTLCVVLPWLLVLTWGHVLVSAGGCVAAFGYLLTFQSMAGRTWCILIGLDCCQSDVGHATGGLADGYRVIYTECVFSVVGQS